MKSLHCFHRAIGRYVVQASLASCTLLAAAVAQAGELTIEIVGVVPDGGKVLVAVYDRADSFPTPGRQLTGQVLAPSDRQVTVHFGNLPPGQYAAVAFQDANGNGKLDKNFLGIPKETYGFSNGARGVAGPPKFSEAAVALSSDATTRIELK